MQIQSGGTSRDTLGSTSPDPAASSNRKETEAPGSASWSCLHLRLDLTSSGHKEPNGGENSSNGAGGGCPRGATWFSSPSTLVAVTPRPSHQQGVRDGPHPP